jgi:hypothetical protein
VAVEKVAETAKNAVEGGAGIVKKTGSFLLRHAPKLSFATVACIAIAAAGGGVPAFEGGIKSVATFFTGSKESILKTGSMAAEFITPGVAAIKPHLPEALTSMFSHTPA